MAAVTDAKTVMNVARDVLGIPRDKKVSEKVEDRRVRSFFGAPAPVIAELWNRIQPLIDEQSRKAAMLKHLLWALVFIFVYSTEEVHCRIVGWPDPKTYRKWSWYMLRKIAALKDDVICLNNRFLQYDGTTSCLISVDGTDCPIFEPWPFDKQWYSKKFNGPQ